MLCEKPMDVSTEKCQQMIDECKKAGRQLAIGYRLHFEPSQLECIRLVREKVFGDLKIIDANFGFTMGDPTQWRLKRALAGGGPLMDVGIYALQATRYLTGEEPISGFRDFNRDRSGKIQRSGRVHRVDAKFPSGVIAHCSTTYNASLGGNFRVSGDKGWFALDPAFNYGGIRGRRSDGQQINFPQIDQFAAEMDDFAQCILENRPTKVPGEEGLRDVKIMTGNL